MSLEARRGRRAGLRSSVFVCASQKWNWRSVIGARLAATGELLNLGGPAEFAAATEKQRARIAASAKDLGIKATQ